MCCHHHFHRFNGCGGFDDIDLIELNGINRFGYINGYNNGYYSYPDDSDDIIIERVHIKKHKHCMRRCCDRF